MLNSFPFSIMVGTVLGVLAGLGTGGGSLLVLWLTMALNMDPATARSINLLFYIPSALVASIFRIKRNDFSIRKVVPAIIAGCICAGIFSYISVGLNVNMLKKLFGILLLFIGVKELLYRPRKAR